MLPLIDIPRIDDDRGSLCVFEGFAFPVLRAYWIFDVQPMSSRGGHAHRTLDRYLIALHGGFRATLDKADSVRLYRPDKALRVEPMRWLDLDWFATGSVCLVLASAEYEESDYIRDLAEWQALTRGAF